MDRAGGNRRGGSSKKGAKGLKTETGKLDIMSNFERVLKELVKRWKRCDDMEERAHLLLTEVVSFGSFKFRVVRALSFCGEGLEHGGWLPLTKAVAVALDVSDRTVRRWVAEYEKNKDTPTLVVVPPIDRGPDPEAQKNLEIARGTHQGLQAGLTQEEASRQAVVQEPLHLPPQPAIHPLSAVEQWTSDLVGASISALAQVPENDKEEVIKRMTSWLLWILTRCRGPIVIIPEERHRSRRRPARRRRAWGVGVPRPSSRLHSSLSTASGIQAGKYAGPIHVKNLNFL
jgi:hypothetical protein